MKVIEFVEALARISEKVIKGLKDVEDEDKDESKHLDPYCDLAQKL